MGISITIIIIIFTCLISFQGFSKYAFIDRLKHSPVRELQYKEYYRLLTSGFIHADWTHLLVNMFVLYSFGEFIENYIISEFDDPWGKVIFCVMYLLNIIIANIPTYLKQKHNPSFASIGASGAVSGIIFIFILLRPWSTLSLFFIIPVPAIILGVGYLIYSSWAAKKGHGNFDHSAHFTGALAGMFMIILLRKEILIEFVHSLINDFPLK
ncbi:MAG TPA: rhomboid family intramembrane serine protease [Saprospiraceae bacterium]|nr:rhomboid family intramembrane serine protease [Saprospiraceae bacterium]